MPLGDDFKVEINLSDVKPNSTIYIYQPTRVTFAIDTKGLEVLNQTITIDVDADIYDNSIYLYPLNSRAVCSEKSSLIFLPSNECVELVSYDFKSLEKVQFEAEEKLDYPKAFLGTNDVVYIRPVVDMLPEGEPEVEGKLYTYNLDTRELINFITFPNKWDNIAISRDGKYVAIYNYSHIKSEVSVYQFSEGEFSLVYQEDFPIYGQKSEPKRINFNEKESNLMIITLEGSRGETYVVNLNDGTKSMKRLVSYICSDPYTGNMVTAVGMDCFIYDQTFTKEVFEQERTDVNYIFSNYLFTSGWGDTAPLYYFNITNYLEK